ncbi:hypothetical protein JCM11491_005723 [Sporobolomyces phaffii]
MTQLPFPPAPVPAPAPPRPPYGSQSRGDPERRASVSSGTGHPTAPPFAPSPSVPHSTLPESYPASNPYMAQNNSPHAFEPYPAAGPSSSAHSVPPPRRSSTLPTTPARPLQPSAAPTPIEDPLIVHHRSLVAYYWHYAQQGYSAPLTAVPGTEESAMQEKARAEAVSWARQCGMQVREVEPRPSAVEAGGARARTASRPLPVAPTPALPSLVAGDSGTPSIPIASRPSSIVGSSGARPLPSAPILAARSVSLANPSHQNPPQTVPPHRSFSEVQPRTQSFPPVRTDSPTHLERKRPLPAPPTTSNGSFDTDQLSRQLQDIAIVGPNPSPAPASSAFAQPVPPVIPTISFGGDEESPSVPPPRSPSPHPTPPVVPTFAFNDEPDETSPSPAIPSFSFSVDDDVNSVSQAPYRSDQRPPPIHPRYDPSHPSHALYHPTSVASTSAPGATSLQSSIEAGTVECTSCQQPIFGRVLMALSRTWHPACFVCAEPGCGEKLEVMEFEGTPEDWEEDVCDGGEGQESLRGKAWCMVHFEERFALQCYHCHTPISSADYLPINDPSLPPTSSSPTSSAHSSTRYYHPLHFFCAGCGDPFLDPVAYERSGEAIAMPYYVRDRHPYCAKCDLRMWREKCPGCKLGIREEDGYVEIARQGGSGRDEKCDEKQKWHEGCFKCSMCSKPLTGIYLLRAEPQSISASNPASDSPTAEKPYCGECFDVVAKEDASAAAAVPRR